MNIFALHMDPWQCARWHVDRHVVKMINESAQLLSNAIHFHTGRLCYNTKNVLKLKSAIAGLPKPTHYEHKCSRWTRETRANYEWLCELFDALLVEYTHRYGKIHKYARLSAKFKKSNQHIPPGKLTPWALAMPDYLAQASNHTEAIERYRDYYAWYKWHIWRWSKREPPPWLIDSSHWPPSTDYFKDRVLFHAKSRSSWSRKLKRETEKRAKR
jgi:hypothetical protein